MSAKVLSILIAMLLLSGCSAAEMSEQAQPSQAADLTESSASQVLDPSLFDQFAITSCEKAMNQGVEEITSTGSYRQVMIPKEQAIEGYSAAWEDIESGEVGLIWEADSFLACAPAMTIWLAEEAGERPAWEVTGLADGFELFQDFGEFGTQLISFSTEGVVFVAAQVQGGEVFEINYAPNLAEAAELIGAAKDEFESAAE